METYHTHQWTLYKRVNIDATVNLAKLSIETGVQKFIYVSTDEVYGECDLDKDPKTTLSVLNPTTPYSASKASAEYFVKAYYRCFNMPIIITRGNNVFGRYQYPEKLIPTLIFNILNNNPLPIYGKGGNSREWIYVDDHCEALIKLFFRGKSGEKYNIGSGINCTNTFLVKKILKTFTNKKIKVGKKVKIIFVKDRPGHDFRYSLNSNKIKRKLKWKPKINLNQGISKTIDWYIENQSYFSNISKKLFSKRLGKR